MASDQSSHDATHYSMDGRNGGMIKVPVEAITEFNTVLFGDIDNGTPVFIIEKRRGDFASLVFDIDFGEMDIQIQDALSYAHHLSILRAVSERLCADHMHDNFHHVSRAARTCLGASK